MDTKKFKYQISYKNKNTIYVLDTHIPLSHWDVLLKSVQDDIICYNLKLETSSKEVLEIKKI